MEEKGGGYSRVLWRPPKVAGDKKGGQLDYYFKLE